MEGPTAPDYQQKVSMADQIERRIEELNRRRSDDLRDLGRVERWYERRKIDHELETLEQQLYAARAHVSAEAAWRQEKHCPPDRTRQDHERFLVERARLNELYGHPPTEGQPINTFEGLRKWEAWGKAEEEWMRSLTEATNRGGAPEWQRENLRQKLEYGWIEEGEYHRHLARLRDEEDLQRLRMDLVDMRAGRDPDDFSHLSGLPQRSSDPQIREMLDWPKRRPEVERRVDELPARARARGFELSKTEKELIETLQQLRQAENERRYEIELERDERER